MHLASHYAYSEPTRARFTSEDNDTAFTVDGDLITLQDLREWVAKQVEELRDLLYNTLFFGEDFSVSKRIKAESGCWIKDDLINSREGYSFATDKANPFRKERYSLAAFVMNDPKLQKRFCTQIGAQSHWRKGPVVEYLSNS